MFRTCGVFAVALALSACATVGTPSGAPAASELAWLDSLDDRYQAFHGTLVLASWQRAIGEEPVVDTAAADRAHDAFYADRELRSRLERLSSHSSADVSVRARAWIRFLDRSRLQSDPKVAALDERIANAVDGDGSGEPAMMLVKNLVLDPDPNTQRRALDEISKRSQVILPLFVERARRFDQLAREMGAPDVATFVAGPDALNSLAATCRAQIERTQDDWKTLLATLEARLGRSPELSDYAGAAVSWTQEAGAFFTPDRIGPLAEAALQTMGFDVRAMKIVIRINPNTAGGSAYGISIPDDVRFQGNFSAPGFDSARGYFHELGHAVHMKMVRAKHLPDRQLPQDRALNEGIGEIFGLIPRDPEWIEETFPATSPQQRAEFHRSVRAFDALAVRYNCLQARLEQELYAGQDITERWPVLYEDTFGSKATIGPTWILLHPSYVRTPFYMRGYVYLNEVRDTFIRRLEGRSLLSREAGRLLTETLLAPGNALTLEAYLRGDRAGASKP